MILLFFIISHLGKDIIRKYCVIDSFAVGFFAEQTSEILVRFQPLSVNCTKD